LRRKIRIERASKADMSPADDDQTAPTRGSRKWRAKAPENPPSRRNSPSDASRPSGESRRARARRLNRGISASMRR
jgi:hypothetical protein